MLEEARASVAGAALAGQPGNGKTSQDENAGPKVVHDGAVLTLKLH